MIADEEVLPNNSIYQNNNLNRHSAFWTRDPDSSDNSALGFIQGDTWVNTSTLQPFILVNSTGGIWSPLVTSTVDFEYAIIEYKTSPEINGGTSTVAGPNIIILNYINNTLVANSDIGTPNIKLLSNGSSSNGRIRLETGTYIISGTGTVNGTGQSWIELNDDLGNVIYRSMFTSVPANTIEFIPINLRLDVAGTTEYIYSIYTTVQVLESGLGVANTVNNNSYDNVFDSIIINKIA